jgi:hypothetical protein
VAEAIDFRERGLTRKAFGRGFALEVGDVLGGEVSLDRDHRLFS